MPPSNSRQAHSLDLWIISEEDRRDVRMKQIIHPLFAQFDSAGEPGLAAAVTRNGKVLFAEGYGLANLETGAACSTRTNFRLASLTKQFTSMAVMILAERSQLRLDDLLTTIFPEYPAHGHGVTLRHLLAHRSGLLDYEELIPASTTMQVNDNDVLQLLRQQDKTYFPPGSAFRYSNTGYVFLALVVEKISGQGFAEFLRENIFRPLKMEGTVAFQSGISTIRDRAIGYTGKQQTDQSVTSATMGDGGIYSSVADLLLWDRSFYTTDLISAEMMQEAFRVYSPETDFPGSGYGFGWYLTRHRDAVCHWHYGESIGFSTYIERYPEKRMTVILLANRTGAPLADMSRALVETFWNEPKPLLYSLPCSPPFKPRT
jgi:CubicO group peptidase (beta-lactamase class C family)